MDDEVRTGEGLKEDGGPEAGELPVEEAPPAETGATAAPAPEEGAKTLDADTILDTLVPDSIDWRNTVQRHPASSVLAVALAGYVLGRTRGAAIVAGLTAGISTAITRQLSDVLEGEFFEFE